jgi:hypothetical protein
MPLEEFVFARNTGAHDWIWAGGYSHCYSKGAIVETAKQIIEGLPKQIRLVVPMSDGLSDDPNPAIVLRTRKDFEKDTELPNTIVGVLCTRNFYDPRAFLMPLDDESFMIGVIDTVSRRVPLPAWEDRNPIAYWRGCMSGGYAPTPRTRLVWDLQSFPHADVKLTRIHRQLMVPAFQGQMTDENDTRFYDVERGLEEHVKNKYIFIVDGNCIASAHQWVFASGSVPIMVTHPANDWWFRKYLIPMVHYVPINYDLSDLKGKIEWLVANDDKAKEIATHAMEFARTVLSSEFQHGYLIKEIKRAAGV